MMDLTAVGRWLLNATPTHLKVVIAAIVVYLFNNQCNASFRMLKSIQEAGCMSQVKLGFEIDFRATCRKLSNNLT